MTISTTMIIRLDIEKSVASFGDVASGIAGVGGDIIAIDVIRAGREVTTRDITVNVQDAGNVEIIRVLSGMPGIKVVNVSDRTFLAHLGGKIEVTPKLPIKNREDLSQVYTPGVARVSMAIAEDKSKAYTLTMKRNTVAVVTDGTAVLGLGDIGPEAAMPVMEGKAMLFKQLAGIDAFPLCPIRKIRMKSSESSRRSPPASAASTWRISPRPAASTLSGGWRRRLISPSSTMISTVRRSSFWRAC